MGKRNYRADTETNSPYPDKAGRAGNADSPKKVCVLIIENSNGKVLIQPVYSERFQKNVLKPFSHKESFHMSDDEVIKKTVQKFIGLDYDTRRIEKFDKFDLLDKDGKTLQFIPCYLKLQNPIGNITGNFCMIKFHELLGTSTKKPITIKGKKESFFATEALVKTMRFIEISRSEYRS